MKKITSGFTLIEVMITAAIIAILAGIAYPNYQDYVRKSRRADARAVMVEAAQWMERFYTANFRFDQDRAGTAVTDPTQFPSSGLTVSPRGSAPGQYYNINVVAPAPPAPPSFTLSAVPTNAQSSDVCGTLTLTNTGAKGQAVGKTVNECWR